MFFYNPKSRRSIRIEQSQYYRFGRFWQFRRFDASELNKVTNALFFFFFSILALRIGGISFFSMADFSSVLIAEYSVGINKPNSENAHKPPGSARHRTFISMDVHGNIKLNGKKCYITDIVDQINNEESRDPQLQIALIIDRDTKMEKVNELLNKLKGDRWRKLYFLTKGFSYTYYK